MVKALRDGACARDQQNIRFLCQRVFQAAYKAAITIIGLRSLAQGTLKKLRGQAVEAFGDELADRSVALLAPARHRLLTPTQLSKVEARDFSDVPFW